MLFKMKLLWIFLLLWVTFDGVSSVFWKPKQRSYKLRSRPPPHSQFTNSNVNLHGHHSMNHNQVVHGPPPHSLPSNHLKYNGPPKHGHHHHGPPKSYNSFPGIRFPKPSSSNIHRYRLRPPPHHHHPIKSYRPPKNHGPNPNPHYSNPTASGSHHQNSFNTPSEGPPTGIFNPTGLEFKQSEIPNHQSGPGTGSGFYGSSDNFIRPSKEYPSFPFMSNTLTESTSPHYESIGLSTSLHETKQPGDNKEHGWTAATYKGWRPISKPPSYYIDRQKKQQQHSLISQQSQAIPISFLPPSTSPASSTTTEVYRDVGGKHQKMMMSTLFRDNVKNIKPSIPVKLKPDFGRDPGILIPLPDEVGAGTGIRIPTNIFFDDFGRNPNEHSQLSFSNPRPYPHPENHKPGPSSFNNNNVNSNAPPPQPPQHLSQTSINNNNLAASHSEEAPVRQPFPKFRPSFRPLVNDSNGGSSGGSSSETSGSAQNSSPESNSNTNTNNANAVLNKFKSSRPKFQRRPTHPRPSSSSSENDNGNNGNSGGGNDEHKDEDEVGPPKINSQSSSNVKEKITKSRTRTRGGNGRKPDGFVGTSDIGQVLQSNNGPNADSSNNNNGNNESPEHTDYSYPQRQPGPPYPDLMSDLSPPPPPTGSGEIFNGPKNNSLTGGGNFGPPPLYGGGFYGHDQPLSPPPSFYDPVSSHFLAGGGQDGNYIVGPPTTVIPTNIGSSGPSSSGINTPNPNKAPRAGPGSHGPNGRKKKPKHPPHGGSSNTYNNYNGPTKPPQPQPQSQSSSPQQQQQQQQHQIVYENNIDNNNGPSPFTSQQGFFIPPEFTQIPTGTGPHQPVSFMTMPGSKPNVIRHNYEYQQQPAQQSQQQHHPMRLQHQSNSQQFQHEPSPLYPINILGNGQNFPPKHSPPQFSPNVSPSSNHGPSGHHGHHHGGHGPFTGPGAYTPIPAGTMPHHQRQKQRPFETTTIRNPFTHSRPPPHHHHNDIKFSPHYPTGGSGFDNNNNGEIFQRQPTNSYKLPVLNSGGSGPPKKYHRGPPPPPPPPSGPGNHHGPRPHGPPPHHSYRNPATGPHGYIGPMLPPPNSVLSSSEQYEQIPMEFMNHLKPILLGEGESQLAPISASPTPFSTSSMRPPNGFFMSSSTQRYRHAHQSPEIHPPSQYFDEFFKPFQDSYPQASTGSTTDRIPVSSTTFPTRGNVGQNQGNVITIPKPKIPMSGHFDSHKSPSINFEQFLRPQIHNNNNNNNNNMMTGVPGRRHPPMRHNVMNNLQNDISSDPVYSVAPIHDFSVVGTTISPIQDFDLFFNSKKPHVWSKAVEEPNRQSQNNHPNENDFFGSSAPSEFSSASTENYYLPPAASTAAVTPSSISSVSASTSTTAGHRPTVLRIKESDLPASHSQEIRATHRPIFKPKPIAQPELENEKESATTYKPISTSSLPPTSFTLNSATTIPQDEDHLNDDKESVESLMNNNKKKLISGTLFSNPIPSYNTKNFHPTYKSPVYHHPRLSSTVSSFSSSSTENDNDDDLIDSSIPNSYRHRKPMLTTTTTPTPTTLIPDDQTDPSTSTFTSKRYLRRRKPGLFANAGNRKRFFSSKLNPGQTNEGLSEPSFMATSTEQDQLIDHKINFDEGNDPPVTTHRPQRKYKPTASPLTTTPASTEEIVTQPFVYPRKRLLQKRKHYPPAARLGLPAKNNGKDKSSENVKEDKESHEIDHQQQQQKSHNHKQLDSGVKSRFSNPNGAQASQHGGTMNINNILTSIEVGDKNDHQRESKGGDRDTTPNSAVTYGESQWFRVKNPPTDSNEEQVVNNDDDHSEEKLKKRATIPLKVNQPKDLHGNLIITSSSSVSSSSSSSSTFTGQRHLKQQQNIHKNDNKDLMSAETTESLPSPSFSTLRHRTISVPQAKLIPLDSSSLEGSLEQEGESSSPKYLKSRPRMLPQASPMTQSNPLELEQSIEKSIPHDQSQLHESLNQSNNDGIKANDKSITITSTSGESEGREDKIR